MTETAIDSLAADPRVAVVEQDFQIDSAATQWTVWNGNNLWDLDRLDEATYWSNDLTYDMCPEGRTVYAYVLDTGVRSDHEQFNGGEPTRVIYSRAFDDGTALGYNDTTNGCAYIPNEWHGTAVASKLAGSQVGASKTKIISVRVFNCASNFAALASWIVSGIEWIRSSADPYKNYHAVVNWSGALEPFYGTDDANAITTATRNLVQGTWTPFFLAADNYSGDACQYTPASLAYTNANHNGFVFVVGGTSVGVNGDKNDYRWQTWTNDGLPAIGPGSGSDGGRCVSIYAPACGIYAASNGGPVAYVTSSGTSFSAPLVAGIAARYMEKTGVIYYAAIYDYLLNAARNTGTIVNNVNTPEYWMCRNNSGQYFTSRTAFYPCPTGYFGANLSSTPVHMLPTFNESNAGMVFSDMTCP